MSRTKKNVRDKNVFMKFVLDKTLKFCIQMDKKIYLITTNTLCTSKHTANVFCKIFTDEFLINLKRSQTQTNRYLQCRGFHTNNVDIHCATILSLRQSRNKNILFISLAVFRLVSVCFSLVWYGRNVVKFL